jgi:putative endonuclease
MLRCADNSLYTGWTTDLRRRLNEHNSTSRGARFTRARRPCTLVYYEVFENENPAQAKREAMSREWFIKNRLSKAQKEELADSKTLTPL